MKALLVSALAVAVAGLAGCDRATSTIPTAPATVSTSATPIVPTVTEVLVSGKTELSVVGETTQLTAVGRFSDGSTRGITGEALWTSSDPSVMAVSEFGVVTVVRFGQAFVSATYDTKTGGQTIAAVEANRG